KSVTIVLFSSGNNNPPYGSTGGVPPIKIIGVLGLRLYFRETYPRKLSTSLSRGLGYPNSASHSGVWDRRPNASTMRSASWTASADPEVDPLRYALLRTPITRR